MAVLTYFSVRSARPIGWSLSVEMPQDRTRRAFLNILLRSGKIVKFRIPINSQKNFKVFNTLLDTHTIDLFPASLHTKGIAG